MAGLEFRNVQKSFGAVRALKGVTFSVAEGEAHGLVGENGAGKSTLLKILAGIIHPDAGDLIWAGDTITMASPREALERGIGMVYQEMLCFPNLTVAGNIFAGREITAGGGRLCEPEMRARTRDLLAELHLPIDPGRAGRVPLGCPPPAPPGGARARVRLPDPGAGRADHRAHRRGGRAPVQSRREAQGARHDTACTSLIGCRRSFACAIRSP